MKKNIIAFLSLSLFLSSFSVAKAEIAGKQWLRDEVIKQDFFLWLGVYTLSFPSYYGSDTNKFFVRPIIEVDKRIKNETPLLVDKFAGIGVKLLDSQHSYFGVTGFWRRGWDAEDKLTGLDDRDGSLKASAVMGYANNDIGFETVLISSWGLTGDVKGLVITAKAEQEFRLNHLFRPTIGAKISWGDEKYMNNYFGISDSEAANAVYISKPYAPKSGFRDARIYINNRFDIHKNVRLYMDAYTSFILDEAKASPIVSEVGSDINYGGGFGVSFRF